MTAAIRDLEHILSEYVPLLQSMDDGATSIRPAPGKWSKKEIIGHLVDSAQNNIRRFIVSQYEVKPCIIYAQDIWVTAAGYNEYALENLLQLWRLLNIHLVSVLKHIPSNMWQNEVQTEGIYSLEWLANDYNKHLRHHLHQLLALEEVQYP